MAVVLLDKHGLIRSMVVFDTSSMKSKSAVERRSTFLSVDSIESAWPWTDLITTKNSIFADELSIGIRCALQYFHTYDNTPML